MAVVRADQARRRGSRDLCTGFSAHSTGGGRDPVLRSPALTAPGCWCGSIRISTG